MAQLLVRFLKLTASVLLFLLWLALLLSVIQHIQSRRYVFAPPQPFTGNHLYNPYAGADTVWQQCNFHAHTHAWGGLTDGRSNEAPDLLEKYRQMGYDVACISDYHSINPQQDMATGYFIPVYEHGYNLFKAHRLVLGTNKVSFFDISLWHNLHDRQYILEQLLPDAKVLAVAHPKFGGGHRLEDFEKLTGYHLMEVLNHYRLSDKYWDVALSAGKPVWIIGNDDNHNITKPDETGVKWTMIAANHLQTDTLLEHLKRGFAYGVAGKNGQNDIYLKQVRTDSLTLTIETNVPALEIKLIGQNGQPKMLVYNTSAATYAFAPNDTYIRAEISSPACKLYLNPVIRYNGIQQPENKFTAQYNPAATLLMRVAMLLLLAAGTAGTLLALKRLWRTKAVVLP